MSRSTPFGLSVYLFAKWGFWTVATTSYSKVPGKVTDWTNLFCANLCLACAASAVNAHERKQKWSRKDLACPPIRPQFSPELLFRSLLLVVLPFNFQYEHPAHGKVREVIRPSPRPSRSSKKKDLTRVVKRERFAVVR
jgi:hypothetical protein